MGRACLRATHRYVRSNPNRRQPLSSNWLSRSRELRVGPVTTMTPSFRWRSDRNTTQRGYAEVAPKEGLAHLRMAPPEVHHMENKGFYINDLPQSGEVTFLAAVIEKELRPKRNGGSFLSVRLADRSGELDAKAWDNPETVAQLFDCNDVVKVRGAMEHCRHERGLYRVLQNGDGPFPGHREGIRDHRASPGTDSIGSAAFQTGI